MKIMWSWQNRQNESDDPDGVALPLQNRHLYEKLTHVFPLSFLCRILIRAPIDTPRDRRYSSISEHMLRYDELKHRWHPRSGGFLRSVFPSILPAAFGVLILLSALHPLPHAALSVEDPIPAERTAADLPDFHDHQEEVVLLQTPGGQGKGETVSPSRVDRMIDSSSRTVSPQLPPPK
jgi:hypothetical protein